MTTPTTLPSTPAAVGANKLSQFFSGTGHASGINLMIADILAIWNKVGISTSTPIANRVLRGTGTGTSAWGQVATGDIATDAITQRPAAATGSTDPTTTSASAVALANPTVTITTTGGDVLVLVRTTINISTSAVLNLYVRESVANSFVLVGDVSPPSSAGRQTVSGFHLFTGLSAASHTFDMGWATSTGTATSYGTSRRIEVIELKK